MPNTRRPLLCSITQLVSQATLVDTSLPAATSCPVFSTQGSLICFVERKLLTIMLTWCCN